MIFYMPVKVFSEENCVTAHSAELAALGTHALIVTGRSSSKKNGSLDDIITALETHKVKYTLFDEVEENPSAETVMKARDIGVNCGADFVIGVGGGSPIDAAKAIAVMIKSPESSWELISLLPPFQPPAEQARRLQEYRSSHAMTYTQRCQWYIRYFLI